MSDKPTDINEYKKWLKCEHNAEVSSRTVTYYDSVSQKVKSNFEQSEFWTSLVTSL